MSTFLGIDGGATKTNVVLIGSTDQPLGSGQSGPSNYHIVGLEQATANLAEAIGQALAGAGVQAGGVQAVCAGLAGFDGPSDVQNVRYILTNSLRRQGIHCAWHGFNDAVVAWAGAFRGQPGALIAAGSGAVAFAVGPGGRSARADGLGHWLGDAGSGFAIGRAGLRAALAALDGRGPETGLTQHFLARAGAARAEWVGWIAELDISIAHAHLQLRSFAPCVVQAAAEGDTIAGSILKEAGEDLADTAASVLRKADALAQPRVAVTGSLFTHSAELRRAFRAALIGQLPGCAAALAQASPEWGGALLARCPALIPQDALHVSG